MGQKNIRRGSGYAPKGNSHLTVSQGETTTLKGTFVEVLKKRDGGGGGRGRGRERSIRDIDCTVIFFSFCFFLPSERVGSTQS